MIQFLGTIHVNLKNKYDELYAVKLDSINPEKKEVVLKFVLKWEKIFRFKKIQVFNYFFQI